MAKVKNILRCYAMGIGMRSIANVFRISRNTVRKYVRWYQDSGLTMPQVMQLSDDHLQDLLSEGRTRERTPSPRQVELEALLPGYAKRLNRKGVTMKSLYDEYAKSYPDGYKETFFKTLLRRYMCEVKVVGHVEHPAGDQMYIDYAGDRLEIVDAVTGEVVKVEVFVAILPCSHYTYCEAVWSQRKEDLIMACERALRFYGGAPRAIVPDNLKSAVTLSDRNEPIINEEFAAFAEFYNCAVYPARVRRPKDKALVENAVKLMYRSVYQDISGLTFHNLESLNDAIRTSLDAFNNKKMASRKQSRREQFDEFEASFLQPLPEMSFQMNERKTATVLRNGYVTLNKHHYSMPKEYIGKRVDIIYDADTLSIYHGMKLVTTHHRDDTPYAYTQKDVHKLPGRKGSYEKDIEEIYQRAAQIDNILLVYLKEVAAEQKYPPIVFKACRGIMSLENKYGLSRLVAACAYATQGRFYGYQAIKGILERGEDMEFISSEDGEFVAAQPTVPVQHKNIRGRDYYSNKSKEEKNGNK